MSEPKHPPSFRRAALACGIALAVITVCVVCPGIESVEGAAEPIADRAEEGLVRVHLSGEPGIVYDKEQGWVAAKVAELFPRAAARTIPADYVETTRGLIPASVRGRPPLYR